MYNPNIKNLIDKAIEDWGNAASNRQSMIGYNIGDEFDKAVWGIPIGHESEIVTIQGPIKNRKSTLLANLILNFAFQLKEKGSPYFICVDALESGMSPKSYRDVMIGMIATRIMVSRVYATTDRSRWPSAAEIIQHPELKPHLNISRRFFRYRDRTSFQLEAITQAMALVETLPITLFGAPSTQGNTRDLDSSMARWRQLYEGNYQQCVGKQHRLFAVDHVQQYSGGGGDYSNLEKVTDKISSFAAGFIGSVVIPLSQVSLTSIRENESGSGKLRAKGGEKLAAESNLVLDVTYDKELAPLELKISASEGRDETPPTMIAEIQPTSGVFLRYAYPAVERRYR